MEERNIPPGPAYTHLIPDPEPGSHKPEGIMSVTVTTVAGGAAAAAARRRAEEEEEEHMTGYSTEDLNGWEFKIIRSAFGRFNNPARVQQVLTEESRAGWEFLEKFDSDRIRLKRRTEHRKNDATLGYDAYRTMYGIPTYGIALLAAGIAVAVILLGVLLSRH
jgi:hypothetical protein